MEGPPCPSAPQPSDRTSRRRCRVRRSVWAGGTVRGRHRPVWGRPSSVAMLNVRPYMDRLDPKSDGERHRVPALSLSERGPCCCPPEAWS
jgi:hypothetical protein